MKLEGKARTVAQTLGVVLLMGGLAWASVPFYDWFCRVTGFGGATDVAEEGSDTILDQTITVRFDASQFTSARWISGPKDDVNSFVDANKQHISHDHDGDIVYLTRLQWDIDRVVRDHPSLTISATKEMQV